MATSTTHGTLPDLAFPTLYPLHEAQRPPHAYQYTVTILHPAYDPPGDILIVFNATDATWGAIHYETARIACGIIAGNRWDGYFTIERDGPRVAIEPNGLLSKGRFYFHIPGPSSPCRYPVVPSFAEWSFPHDDLPSFWASGDNSVWPTLAPAASTSSIVTARDRTCRISGMEEACEMAHIIPAQEQEWYNKNGMRSCIGANRKGIADASNMILLRKDLHFIFDAGRLVFVPKAAASSNAACWVAHAMVWSKDLLAQYHNHQLHDMSSIPQQYLLARFAWTFFPEMENFLVSGIERLLVVVSRSKESFIASPQECKGFLPQPNKPKSRSQSPTKRPREAEEAGSGAAIKRARLDTSPPPSAPIMSDSSLESIISTGFNAEDAALQRLVRASLQKERHRSDPGGTWASEQAWMREQDVSIPMSPKTRRRWYLAQGSDLEELHEVEQQEDYPVTIDSKVPTPSF